MIFKQSKLRLKNSGTNSKIQEFPHDQVHVRVVTQLDEGELRVRGNRAAIILSHGLCFSIK